MTAPLHKDFFDLADASHLINVYGFALFPLYGILDGKCTCGNPECWAVKDDGKYKGSPGKHPATKHGLKDATKDIKALTALWADRQHLNVGIATGEPSGVFVIDIDGPNGERSIAEKEAEHGKLPATLTVTTGRGRHLFFKYPGEKVKTVKGILSDVDVRGDGGYVAGPGSNHISGKKYEFVNPLEITALAPEWILDLVLESRTKKEAGHDTRHRQDHNFSSRPPEWSNDEIRDMLSCVPVPDDYDEWYKIGMALKDGGYGFEIWDSWSRQSSKYNAPEMRKKWDSFKGSGLTIGTLVYRAKQGGWKPKRDRRESYTGGNGAASSRPPVNLQAFSLGELLADTAPIPDDLIAPRLLTPGGILVFGGAPKVGKSDFILSLLCHLAAGASFLGLTPPRPLRIFYLQAEIMKPYLIERLRQIKMPDGIVKAATENLVITPQLKILLNENGVAAVMALIKEKFPHDPPDIIVIDPIRNVFDGGPDDSGIGENDNNAMLFFLQERVETLRDTITPDAGIILVHHTKKMTKNVLKEDPFQALSGASSLRSYYSSGAIMYRPDESQPVRCLVTELRNGPGLSAKYIDKIQGQWTEVNNSHVRLIKDDYGHKLDAERERRHDVIVQLIEQDSLQGILYTVNAFAEKYEGKNGLGSKTSINDRIGVLMTKGDIKCFRAVHPVTGKSAGPSKFGFMCIENMRLGPVQERITEDGEVLEEYMPVKPTHYKTADTGAIMPVENPDIWVRPPGE